MLRLVSRDAAAWVNHGKSYFYRLIDLGFRRALASTLIFQKASYDRHAHASPAT